MRNIFYVCFTVLGLVIFQLGVYGQETAGQLTKSPTSQSEELSPDYKTIKATAWNDSTLATGVVWKHYHFSNLFASNQFVNVLDVNLSVAEIAIDIPHVTEGFIKTSQAALDNGATAAINGSYFNTTAGGSTVFFRKNGIIVKNTEEGFTHYRENGAFAITRENSPAIIKRPSSGWESADSETILSSGPLLIYGNEIIEQEQTAFNLNRHPRTAIGITANNHIIAVVVDGRNAQSQGMNIEELSILMKALGCVEALNMDGGGSSTMWINNKGVVNHPSDNKLFDNEGERGVATIITFKGNYHK